MSVRMTGGPSGNRENFLPDLPTGGSPQPVLDTSNNSGVGPGVRLMLDPSGNREVGGMPPVPSGGTVPEDSTDVCDPGARP